MKHPPIICRNCGRVWPAPRPYALHQRLALEASPCPACGSATLSCPDPAEIASPAYAPGKSYRRPVRFARHSPRDDRAA